MQIDAGEVMLPGQVSEVREHAVFDTFAKNATAQQKGINIERVGLDAADHDPNEAVIAKAITDGHREKVGAGIGA